MPLPSHVFCLESKARNQVEEYFLAYPPPRLGYNSVGNLVIMDSNLSASYRHFQRVLLLLLLGLDAFTGSAAAQSFYASSGGNIHRVDANGTVTLFTTIPSGFATGMAFDTSGNLYVASAFSSDFIYKIAPSGATSVYATLPANSTAEGLAFDSSGNLFVVTLGTRKIHKITPSGTVSDLVTFPLFTAPFGLVIDSSDNLYSTNDDTGDVSRITPSGTVSIFGNQSSLADPRGLAIDPSGNVYVANSGLDTIGKVTPTGVVSTFATVPSTSSLRGLALDDAGNLYAADIDNNQILKFTPSGTMSTFATGVASPLFIVPIPEPGCVVLLGFGALLLGARRQRSV